MTEKYRGGDVAIFLHPSGKVLRLDPAGIDEKVERIAAKNAFARYTPPEDGFRPRRTRDPEHMKRLIAEGVVVDPANRQPHQTYSEETFVVDVPLGRLGATARDTE